MSGHGRAHSTIRACLVSKLKRLESPRVKLALSPQLLTGAFGITVILIVLSAIVAGQSLQIEQDQEVVRIQTILTQLEGVHLALVDAEARQRA